MPPRSPARTFAPLWEVFRISSDKLALCHLELMKKLHDLIKEISRYGEEQGRVHKKVPRPTPSSPAVPQIPPLPCPPSSLSIPPPPTTQSKEEVSGTLEAVQLLHGVAQLLPKSKESYHSKCQEYERLRKEGTSQKEIDKVRPPTRPSLSHHPGDGPCPPATFDRLPLGPAGRAEVQEGRRGSAAGGGEVQRCPG